MPSDSFGEYKNNIIDVEKLISVHSHLNNGSRGKKGLGHITRSGIVMLSACWELYIEGLLIESIDFLSDKINDPDNLPKKVRKTISFKVKDDKHELKPLALANEGWKEVYRSYAELETDYLNTPNTHQVNSLYYRYLGKEDFIESLPRIDNEDLDDFISDRGEIAHKGRSAKYIRIGDLRNDKQMVEDLVREVDEYILDYLTELNPDSTQPWYRSY